MVTRLSPIYIIRQHPELLGLSYTFWPEVLPDFLAGIRLFLMSKLPEKIQSATRELRQLQQEIQSPLPAAGPRLAELDTTALKEFKAVIDYVRQLLWTYIQADNAKGGRSVDEEVLSLRLQRVTEMLHTIQEEVNDRQLAPNEETVSFLNAVQEIADAAFQRYKTSEPDEERAS